MIIPGKITVAIVSFNPRCPEKGPFASLRSPFHNLEAGALVVVSDGSHNPIPRIAVVRQVEWIKPPYNSFHSPACILTYLNVKALLKDSMESQKEAYEEAVRHNSRRAQRKKELEIQIQKIKNALKEMQKELDNI